MAETEVQIDTGRRLEIFFSEAANRFLNRARSLFAAPKNSLSEANKSGPQIDSQRVQSAVLRRPNFASVLDVPRNVEPEAASAHEHLAFNKVSEHNKTAWREKFINEFSKKFNSGNPRTLAELAEFIGGFGAILDISTSGLSQREIEEYIDAVIQHSNSDWDCTAPEMARKHLEKLLESRAKNLPSEVLREDQQLKTTVAAGYIKWFDEFYEALQKH